MSDSRFFKVKITACIGVYVPKGRLADRATPKAELLDRLYYASDSYSDGRRPLSVEQLHAGAEAVVRNAIEWLADSKARDDGYQGEALDNHIGLAMARVSVKETELNEEHALDFEIIEEDAPSDRQMLERAVAILREELSSSKSETEHNGCSTCDEVEIEKFLADYEAIKS